MADANINFAVLENAVEKCCKTEAECGGCNKLKCLVGFAWNVAKYGNDKGMTRVAGGKQLLPVDDYRVFYEDDVIVALAETLKQCKNCSDNHDEDCSVSLIRGSLEHALLGENLDYKGSVLSYLMELQTVNPRIGQLVAEGYRGKAVS
jgi:hypothetical protein